MPFDNTPDPHFFFATPDHEEALAALCYGVRQQRGITLVTAKPGCGKTMLGRILLETLGPEARTVTITHAPDNGRDLMGSICRGFGVHFVAAHSTGELIERLDTTLMTGSHRDLPLVLIIDEAHNLSVDVLEHICLLANLETSTARLLQIVMLGQPELASTLAEPRLEQLRQRIFCVRQLSPLDREQTHAYIRHRLERAGAHEGDLFVEKAADLIYEHSGGIPRIINQLADNALLSAFADSSTQVDSRGVSEVVAHMMSLRSAVPSALAASDSPPPRVTHAPIVHPGTAATSQQVPATSHVPSMAEPQTVRTAAELEGSLMQLVQAGSEIAGRLTEANRSSASQADKLADRVYQLTTLLSQTGVAASQLSTSRMAARLRPHVSTENTEALRRRLHDILAGPQRPIGSTRPGAPETELDRQPVQGGRLSMLRQDITVLPEDGSRGMSRNLQRLIRQQQPLATAVAESVSKLNAGHQRLMERYERIKPRSPVLAEDATAHGPLDD